MFVTAKSKNISYTFILLICLCPTYCVQSTQLKMMTIFVCTDEQLGISLLYIHGKSDIIFNIEFM